MLRRLFGQRKKAENAEPAVQSEAAVWELLVQEWDCREGHAVAGKPMDIAVASPDPWPHSDSSYEPNNALSTERDFLSEDFCILKEADRTNYFIRAVMEFPIQGVEAVWGFGCWTSLSRENFDRYVDGFDAGVYPEDEPWFGWLCNRLRPVFNGPEPLPLAVAPQQDRQRPKLWVREDDCLLARYQDEGLPPSVLLEILQTNGLGPKLN